MLYLVEQIFVLYLLLSNIISGSGSEGIPKFESNIFVISFGDVIQRKYEKHTVLFAWISLENVQVVR